MYVLFWNKGYFDEIYDSYLVTPTIRFARWLWRVIDIKIIDGFIYFIAGFSKNFFEMLWRIVDVRWLDRKVGHLEDQADGAEQLRQELESRAIQHQLLVMIFWLVAMTGLLYILV
jgi:NADH:ubiquinone oxidoreductase subunit 5 (subunit L)/multisubunit Na+/H+ antiporter MnhA subunit